ncbi:S41 family peptidase [Candidatus Kaiserbacteria bacterium]|nr:S41 family peptidase [Candidatus Kaiserbacteria bacterium]
MPEQEMRQLSFEDQNRPAFSMRAALAGGIVILALGFAIGFWIAARANEGDGLIGMAPPENVDFSPVWKAWRVIDEKFVPAAVATTTKVASTTEEANQERVWGMIQGLAESLGDPYTFFLPPKENEIFSEDISGEFTGVGMEIAVRDKVLTVVSPLKGTPAERAGIKSGDKVLEIDGVDTDGMDIANAVSRIRGPKGSVVTLLVMREGFTEPREFKITRAVINIPTIVTETRDDVFVVEMRSFTASSPELFRRALREFVESRRGRLILDMRGNPGGYLDASVDMASWFLPSGRIVVTEDYAGHADNVVHRSRGYDVFNENLRMVILVDRGSASASEILAGALRHYGIATMVGERTFGKGSVQELVEITSDTSLKLTVARWLGPDGEQIPLDGLKPDIEVKLTDKDREEDKDPQLDAALQVVRGL